MIDSFGRTIDYLRISVTDRCNLRCAYCLPPSRVRWQPCADLLTHEEITHVVNVAAAQGIRKIRLTGGEPLVHLELPVLVRHYPRSRH